MTIRFVEEAQREFLDAISRYEEARAGLGRQFKDEVDRSILWVAAHGYVGERLITCLLHSAFVCVALWRLRSRFLLGVAGAMTLHWLCNFPILLMAWDVGGFGKTFWTITVQGWVLLFFFGSLALFSYFTFGRISPARIFYGRRHCPECDLEYDPSMFLALNFGRTRYKRCPHCRHWHWTKAVARRTSTE